MHRQPPGGRDQDDDAWNSVSRDTLDALRGNNPAPPVDEIGDTRGLLRGEGNSIAVGVSDPDVEAATGEIVDLLSRSIADTPYRLDMWMMRFQMYRTLGMKPEFATAMSAAWKHAGVRKQLDWRGVKEMWEQLAPGEALPSEIELVAPPPVAQPVAAAAPLPLRRAGHRRFADVALQTSGDALMTLTREYGAVRAAPDFFDQLARGIGPALSRPTSLYLAQALSRSCGTQARIYLKREDQRRVAPEIENAIGQAYIAKLLGRPRVVTGNDVDAHAHALALVAPRFGLECTVHVRERDLAQRPEIPDKLRALGASVEVAPPADGSEDPRVAALMHWLRAPQEVFLALSLGTGPRPYPMLINDCQSLLGREAEAQLRVISGGMRPRCFVAAVHGESDAIGFMLPQLAGKDELFFTEPEPGTPAASKRSTWMRAYNGLKREHAWLRASGRLRHVAITDVQARAAQENLARLENIQVSIEDARAVAQAVVLARLSARPLDLVVLVA